MAELKIVMQKLEFGARFKHIMQQLYSEQLYSGKGQVHICLYFWPGINQQSGGQIRQSSQNVFRSGALLSGGRHLFVLAWSVIFKQCFSL